MAIEMDLFKYIRAHSSLANIPWKVRSRYPEYLSGKDLAKYEREMNEQAKESEERSFQNCIDAFF